MPNTRNTARLHVNASPLSNQRAFVTVINSTLVCNIKSPGFIYTNRKNRSKFAQPIGEKRSTRCSAQRTPGKPNSAKNITLRTYKHENVSKKKQQESLFSLRKFIKKTRPSRWARKRFIAAVGCSRPTSIVSASLGQRNATHARENSSNISDNVFSSSRHSRRSSTSPEKESLSSLDVSSAGLRQR